MHTCKPLLLAAALGAGIVWAGAAVAAQPTNTFGQTSGASMAATPTITSVVRYTRKIYRFQDLDRDHNGKLRRSELPADMRVLRLHFLQADFSQDGQLSPQEYVMYANGTAPAYAGVYHVATYIFAPSAIGQQRINLP